MIILNFLGILCLLLLLLCLIPIGVHMTSTPDGFDIRFKLWIFSFSLFSSKKKEKTKKKKSSQKTEQQTSKNKKKQPKEKQKKDKKKPTEKKAKKEKKTKQESETKENSKGLSDIIALAQAVVALLIASFNKLGNKKRIHKLELELVVGKENPVDAVMLYGQAHALLGTIWIPLDENLDLEEGRARVVLEFEEVAPAIYGVFILTITIGHLLALTLNMVFGGLKIYKQTQGNSNKKKRKRISSKELKKAQKKLEQEPLKK